MKKSQVRGLRSKNIIYETDVIDCECGHLVKIDYIINNLKCPICNTRFSVNDDSQIVLNAIERLKERLNEES